jgi:hypothetical protein
MKTLFSKTILFALVAVLAVTTMPFVSVSAAGAYQTPPPQGGVSNERLEYTWARQLITYQRIGLGFEYNDTFIQKVQGLIDRATANGKDASEVQAALDAFEAAIHKAQPIYESAGELVTSHQGFDENGKVTDAEQAKGTIQALRQKFEEIKTAMNGTGKALHQAIKAFREANPRPGSTPAT